MNPPSMYEGLKTEAADGADLMVVINVTGAEGSIVEARVSAFLRTGVTEISIAPSRRFVLGGQKYITPHAAHYTLFRNLVSGAVGDFQRRLYAVSGGPCMVLPCS